MNQNSFLGKTCSQPLIIFLLLPLTPLVSVPLVLNSTLSDTVMQGRVVDLGVMVHVAETALLLVVGTSFPCSGKVGGARQYIARLFINCIPLLVMTNRSIYIDKHTQKRKRRHQLQELACARMYITQFHSPSMAHWLPTDRTRRLLSQFFEIHRRRIVLQQRYQPLEPSEGRDQKSHLRISCW